MPLITVGYLKGRPGSTTTALALAAVMPESAGAVLVECDPAGGDLALRHRLARPSPGLVELATATRTTTPREPAGAKAGEVLVRFSQPIRLGDRSVPLVPAPPGGSATRVALNVLTGNRVLAPAGRVVVGDCGRLDVDSPARPLLGAADAVLLLVRGRVEDLGHLREHLPHLLHTVAGRVVVALVAGGGYRGAAVREYLHHHLATATKLPADRIDAVQVRELLPYDEPAAAVLGGDRRAGRGWLRRPFLVAVRRLAADLLPEPPPSGGPAAAAVTAVDRWVA